MNIKQKNNKVNLLLLVIAAIGLMGGVSWGILQVLGGSIKPVTSETKQNNPTVPISLSNSTSLDSSPTFESVTNVPNGLFSNGGSTTWAVIRAKVNQPITKAWPKFQMRYTDPPTGSPGSGQGIKMLLQDQLSFAESSRSLTIEEYQNAVERGFKLKQVPVAIDGLAIAVNPDLNLKGITLNQLKEIYTGKITNWRQLGGPNLPITPYSRPPETGGTLDFFQENILQAQPLAKQIQFVRDTTEGLRNVGKNRGGIYYASASAVVPQCSVKAIPLGRTLTTLVSAYQNPSIPASQCPSKRNQINHTDFKTGKYPITRRLFVIIKENGQLDEQAGNAYANLLLTNEGQDLIQQAGFVKIR
jgi:phosphate transport system substrate-binding protein